MSGVPGGAVQVWVLVVGSGPRRTSPAWSSGELLVDGVLDALAVGVGVGVAAEVSPLSREDSTSAPTATHHDDEAGD